MQVQELFKKWLPNIIAIAAFLLISVVFSSPSLKGELLAPHDTVSWIYQTKDASDYYKEHGKAPHWTNSVFSGMPTAMTYEPTNSNWFNSLSQSVQMQPSSFLVNPIGFLFLTMIGAFVLLKSLKARTLIAAFGGVAYALSSYIPILITAGHITKVIDLAYLPGVIGGLIFIFRNKRITGIVLYGLFLSLFLSAWHLQIIYYSLFIFAALGIYFLVAGIKSGKLKDTLKNIAIVLVLTGVSVLTAFTLIKGTSSYAKYSMRGGASELTHNQEDKMQSKKGGLAKDYAFSWSNGIGEVFCAIIPNYYGGGSGENIGEDSNYGELLSSLGVPYGQVAQMTERAPTYFGPQPFLSGPMYFGAIVCFLSILALFVIKSRLKWVLFGLGIFFAMLSWGKNFETLNFWLFDHLPLFNKFRSPNMAFSLTTITTVALAFWGLYDLEKETEKKNDAHLFKQFKNACIVSLGLMLALILYSQFGMDYKGISDDQILKGFGEHGSKALKALKDDRAAMALKDSFRSLVFILIAMGAIWALLKKKISGTVAIVIIGFASIVDLWGVSTRYLNDDVFMDEFAIEQNLFTPSAPIAQILQQDKDPNFRVLDLTIDYINDAKTSYFVKTVGGYHPAKLQAYQDLITHQLTKGNSAVLNMLNTKYIITKNDKQSIAMPNPKALGNAWFVSNIKYVKTADDAMESLDGPSVYEPQNDSSKLGFQPAVEAIVRDNYQSSIGASAFEKDSTAKIALTHYSLPEMVYESNNSHDGFGVFSEVYYPENWKAFIDGKPTEIIPVNYVLRGLRVPAGKHKIEFKYIDPTFEKGETINRIGSILLTLLLLGTIVFSFLRKKNNSEEESDIDLI
ncbi:MAG TPA: YfhO family protein [Edaphocola sp.]|nr:YfhO family protein [Edaphocola sp.]